MAAAGPGGALKLEPTGTSGHFPPLLDCAPAPATAPSKNASAFRAHVLSLLGALPAAAAAVPTGSASTRSAGRAGRDRAFARGACFGFGASDGPSSPGDYCRSCLSAAAEDVAAGCAGASRRAGAWRAGCFVSYADTGRPTASEDAFRGWFYDDGDDDPPTAALGNQCTANRTAAECARCLNESAQVVPALKEGGRLSMVHGDAVVVVGYACYLRVPLFSPMPRWQQKRELSCPPLYPLSHSIPASSLVVRGRRNQAPDE